MGKLIRSHRDLEVYTKAFSASMELFHLTKAFPRDEVYPLTSQIRRSSRSVVSGIVEAWRKRRYLAAFVAKLSDCETEAAETQLWIEYAVACGYMERSDAARLFKEYDAILRTIVGMINNAEKWSIKPPDQRRKPDDAQDGE